MNVELLCELCERAFLGLPNCGQARAASNRRRSLRP